MIFLGCGATPPLWFFISVVSFFIRTLVLLGLVGCGYHWQSEEDRLTVSVPYGDVDGALTGEIVRTLAISGNGRVRQWGALYRLQASIISGEGETIGYRRDPQELPGGVQKQLLASERRKTLVVEAILYEANSGKIASGPCRVEAYIDFDYIDGDSLQDLVFIGPNGTSQVTLPFSLGQLEAVDAAEEAAMRPLYGHIAEKIVDAIFAEW